MLSVSIECDEIIGHDSNSATGYADLCESVTARFCNDAAENGYDQEPGPLTWLNSARMVADPSEDSVTFLASIDDPRGALAFTIRRCPDGTIVIHVPHPEESLPHVQTAWRHPGTLLIGHTVDGKFCPRNFSDDTVESGDDDE